MQGGNPFSGKGSGPQVTQSVLGPKSSYTPNNGWFYFATLHACLPLQYYMPHQHEKTRQSCVSKDFQHLRQFVFQHLMRTAGQHPMDEIQFNQ